VKNVLGELWQYNVKEMELPLFLRPQEAVMMKTTGKQVHATSISTKHFCDCRRIFHSAFIILLRTV
jgi:hypothetical protein